MRLFQLVGAVGLDDLVDADEGLLEGVEGRRVDHLLLDLGRVRTPGHEEKFGSVRGLGTFGLHHVVVVVDGVATVVVFAILDLKVGQERLVGVVAVAGLNGEKITC